MTYDVLARGALDYMPCRYGDSKLAFRGPKQDLSLPYVAFLGGNEIYGKFIEEPIPALVGRELQISCANFGHPNAGVDLFLKDPFMLAACSRAEMTVLQVLGAGNMSNRMYTVHPRRNDRFVAPSETLRRLFPDVDFAEFHYTGHLLNHLSKTGGDRFAPVLAELEEAWVRRMHSLMEQIESKVVLLWMSDRPIARARLRGSAMDLDHHPLFINREMMERVVPLSHQLVEVVVSEAAIQAGTDGMIFSELDALAASRMFGPKAHREAAQAVAPVLERGLLK